MGKEYCVASELVCMFRHRLRIALVIASGLAFWFKLVDQECLQGEKKL